MRNSMLLAGAALVALAAPGSMAEEQPQGWYLGLGIGFDSLGDTHDDMDRLAATGPCKSGLQRCRAWHRRRSATNGTISAVKWNLDMPSTACSGAPSQVHRCRPLVDRLAAVQSRLRCPPGLGRSEMDDRRRCRYRQHPVHGECRRSLQRRSSFTAPTAASCGRSRPASRFRSWDSLETYVEYRYRQVDANSVGSDFADHRPRPSGMRRPKTSRCLASAGIWSRRHHPRRLRRRRPRLRHRRPRRLRRS